MFSESSGMDVPSSLFVHDLPTITKSSGMNVLEPPSSSSRDLRVFSESSGMVASPSSIAHNFVVTFDESSGAGISDTGSGAQDTILREGKSDRQISRRARREAPNMVSASMQDSSPEGTVHFSVSIFP